MNETLNTAQPVAWRYRYKTGGPWLLTVSPAFYEPEKFEVESLYAHPWNKALNREVRDREEEG